MSYKNLKALFSALPVAIVILEADEPQFTVKNVNKAFVNLSGIGALQLKDKPFFDTLNKTTAGNNENSLNEIISMVRKVLSKKKEVEADVIQMDLHSDQSDDRENLYFQVKCSPIMNKSGSMNSVLLTLNNVTELISENDKIYTETNNFKTRKELIDQSEDLTTQAAMNKAQYKSASQELDDFVYSVSHDLRAPLRRIDGFSQELLNEYADKFDETGAHYLKRIRQGAQDMGQLIDDLLKLSRISRKSVEKEEIDLGEIAKAVFEEIIEMEPEREINLQIEDNLTIEADKGLIKAMLGNLISNAVKFTSQNEVAKIEIGSKLIDENKVFYISDNGVGFDPAYSHKLFKAFSRLHSHNEFSGTGIGLATVKRIMTLHGGTIWAESPKGEGATFYFKF